MTREINTTKPAHHLQTSCVTVMCRLKMPKKQSNMWFLLTYEQLAVELQVKVSVSRSLLCSSRKFVQPKKRFFHVPLSSDSVPPVVVQRDTRLHTDLQRPVTDIEGENHLSGSYKPNRWDRKDESEWFCEVTLTISWYQCLLFTITNTKLYTGGW